MHSLASPDRRPSIPENLRPDVMAASKLLFDSYFFSQGSGDLQRALLLQHYREHPDQRPTPERHNTISSMVAAEVGFRALMFIEGGHHKPQRKDRIRASIHNEEIWSNGSTVDYLCPSDSRLSDATLEEGRLQLGTELILRDLLIIGLKKRKRNAKATDKPEYTIYQSEHASHSFHYLFIADKPKAGSLASTVKTSLLPAATAATTEVQKRLAIFSGDKPADVLDTMPIYLLAAAILWENTLVHYPKLLERCSAEQQDLLTRSLAIAAAINKRGLDQATFMEHVAHIVNNSDIYRLANNTRRPKDVPEEICLIEVSHRLERAKAQAEAEKSASPAAAN